MEDFLTQIRDELIVNIQGHPFLVRCRDGGITLPELKVFLQQQGLYSRHFTRYLCALMSNLKSNDQVLALASNLFEELGLDDDGGIPHSVLYRRMLEAFNLDGDNVVQTLPGTAALIDAMYSHCRDEDIAKGLGALCMGAEALVPSLYADIVSGFDSLGEPAEKTEFFRIHIECDDGHAETMKSILAQLVKDDPSKVDVIRNAGLALVKARLAFFDSVDGFQRIAERGHLERPLCDA